MLYLNNKMLSSEIHAGYEECDITDKIHRPHYFLLRSLSFKTNYEFIVKKKKLINQII